MKTIPTTPSVKALKKKSIPSHVQPLLNKNRDLLSQQMQLQQPVFKYEHIGKKYIFSDPLVRQFELVQWMPCDSISASYVLQI